MCACPQKGRGERAQLPTETNSRFDEKNSRVHPPRIYRFVRYVTYSPRKGGKRNLLLFNPRVVESPPPGSLVLTSKSQFLYIFLDLGRGRARRDLFVRLGEAAAAAAPLGGRDRLVRFCLLCYTGS